MNKILMNGLAMLLLAPASTFAEPSNDETIRQQYLPQSRQTAQAFIKKLGGSLKQQLANNGAESAIDVCKHVAPALAAEYSKDGWIVSRVSLKNRNKTLAKPDAWERGVLEKFDQENTSATSTASLEISAVTDETDGRWFRYMKAIPAQPLCLQCHGKPEEISNGVKAVLNKEYPEDKATGYSAGDIRGAISIKRQLQQNKQ